MEMEWMTDTLKDINIYLQIPQHLQIPLSMLTFFLCVFLGMCASTHIGMCTFPCFILKSELHFGIYRLEFSF